MQECTLGVVDDYWVLDKFPPWIADLIIERPEKYGGNVTFSTYEQLEEAYVKEEVFPLDLKTSVANQLNKVFYNGICTYWHEDDPNVFSLDAGAC